ncbi:unnamed protein product [Cercopithifilaria johnstoni]|uniref:Uncharacterized protein n=1 Tax=Cercopithifilaria johnstoni TaxID=2874296 RepID=A0A8J2PWJ5_9BILA|nr:unnamed protein product [Cercopithifilaria johnstoni]
MFIYFQIFVIITIIGRLTAKPTDEGSTTSKNENQLLCLICQDKQQETSNDVGEGRMGISTLLQYDQAMGIDNLNEIERGILLINSTAWLYNPSDPKEWKDEVAKFKDVYETLTSDEVNKQLEALKVKGNAFTTERDANKQNALKKWHNLPIARLRIGKIEENILNGDSGENINALQRIDKIRNLISEVSLVLQEVYNYYKRMDDELSESYNILSDIEVKLNIKREKEGKVRRSNCIWIFCY